MDSDQMILENNRRIRGLERLWANRKNNCPIIKESADKKTQRQLLLAQYINIGLLVVAILTFLYRG